MAWEMFMDFSQILSNINTCHDFFSWTASGIKTASRHKNAAQLQHKDEIEKVDIELIQLQGDLWKLNATMPNMLGLIERSEERRVGKECLL